MSDDLRSTIEIFTNEVAVGSDDRLRHVALFLAVRGVPYASDGASDAEGLIALGRGNCLARADLLWRGFRRMGIGVRRVKWRYELPPNPPEAVMLPVRWDIHTAVEIDLGGAWVLVDAANDPPLVAGGFTVAGWDGVSATAPNYAPTGPIWRVGADDREIATASAETTARYEAVPRGTDQYQPAFNNWLESLRWGNGGH